jgi:hypothetical protein
MGNIQRPYFEINYSILWKITPKQGEFCNILVFNQSICGHIAAQLVAIAN